MPNVDNLIPQKVIDEAIRRYGSGISISIDARWRGWKGGQYCEEAWHGYRTLYSYTGSILGCSDAFEDWSVLFENAEDRAAYPNDPKKWVELHSERRKRRMEEKGD